MNQLRQLMLEGVQRRNFAATTISTTASSDRFYPIVSLSPLSRFGHATHATKKGVCEGDIMRQTGHKSSEMLAKYIRIGEMFTRYSGAELGI